MTGAPWWVVLAAATIGAAAGIGGSMWSSRHARRSAGRAEWCRRLQWAWELTLSDDRRSVAAGVIMMDYLAGATDRQDGVIIDRIAPIARAVGIVASKYPGDAADVDVSLASGDTERDAKWEDGGPDGIQRRGC